jgi:hypothetical protein
MDRRLPSSRSTSAALAAVAAQQRDGRRAATGRRAACVAASGSVGISSGSRCTCPSGLPLSNVASSSSSKPSRPEIEVRRLQRAQLDGQQFEIPLGQLVRLVVGDPVRLDLVRRQVSRDVDGTFSRPAVSARRLPARDMTRR